MSIGAIALIFFSLSFLLDETKPGHMTSQREGGGSLRIGCRFKDQHPE
jgi:hypothetical protein